MAAKDEIESLMGWWREAGADAIVSDQPASWFGANPKKPRPKATAAAAEAPARPVMPEELEAFQTWWRDHDFEGLPQTGRVGPEGDPASGLMVLLDMPEPGDTEAGRLASGEVGLLLDRMLAAIGRDRASVYLASLGPATMPVGGLDGKRIDALAEAARRHVALAAPRMLLLMGEAPSRTFCGCNLAEARGGLRTVNHEGGSVAAIVTFHPRFLLRQPGLKTESWKDLQLLLEGLAG